VSESKRKVVLGPQDAGRILAPEAAMEEEFIGATLRPRSFDEYVGQLAVVENLKIAIDAARRRDEPLEHVLFYGPPGLGKTTLAALIARDMGKALRPTSGPTLDKPKDLVGILTSLQAGDVLFIDEIHRLGGVVEEFLYPAMEDFRVDIVMDSGAYAKTYKIPVERFTLVGATTRAGMLSAPLRERFGLTYHLDYYSDEELERIVVRSAGVLGIPIDAPGAATIARRSRGTPRVANRLLRRVRDFAEVRADGKITEDPSRTKRCAAKASTAAASTASTVPSCVRSPSSIAAARSASPRSRPRSPKMPRRSKTSSSRICSNLVSSCAALAAAKPPRSPTNTWS
jgi:Holliday junction DNA helicase RuvB